MGGIHRSPPPRDAEPHAFALEDYRVAHRGIVVLPPARGQGVHAWYRCYGGSAVAVRGFAFGKSSLK